MKTAPMQFIHVMVEGGNAVEVEHHTIQQTGKEEDQATHMLMAKHVYTQTYKNKYKQNSK
jgi:hypothetical protein